MKPCGLWVSVDGDYDWVEWCTRKQWLPRNLARRYRIFLRPEGEVLVLSTPEDIIEFTREYRTDDWRTDSLQWDLVRSRHGGLIITPFQWNLRLCTECSWYYSWDCTSGCIWDVGEIERYEEDMNWRYCKGG
jgi:hypothetical protein